MGRHGRIFWSGWNFRPKGWKDIFADYHVHTEFSDDSVYPMEQVVRDAIAGGMDEICFTAHVDYGIKQVDFNEKLFHRLVDYATVYSDGRVVFIFRNSVEGSTEI